MLFCPTYEYFADFPSMKILHVNFKAWFNVMYMMAYHFLVLVTSLILTSFFCAICYQWKQIIIHVKCDLQKGRVCFIHLHRIDTLKKLLQNCRFIWKGTNIIKNTFSTYLSFMIVKNILNIFILTCIVLKRNIFDNFSLGISFYIGIELFYFISTVYLASGIPDEMDNLLELLKQIYEELSLKDKEDELILIKKQIKLITLKDAIVLTAGGWADLRKSLILTCFGNLITYSLIIIQYNTLYT